MVFIHALINNFVLNKRVIICNKQKSYTLFPNVRFSSSTIKPTSHPFT